MPLEALIAEIQTFAIVQTKELIAEFEKQRFAQQGEINDHERWADNQSYAHPGYVSVQDDKGRNSPLIDTGNLLGQLSDPNNWDLSPEWNGTTLSLHIPETEEFTDEIYDVLEIDHGQYPPDYRSIRGNKVKVPTIPGRKFKDISQADVDMITEQLAERMKRQFES